MDPIASPALKKRNDPPSRQIGLQCFFPCPLTHALRLAVRQHQPGPTFHMPHVCALIECRRLAALNVNEDWPPLGWRPEDISTEAHTHTLVYEEWSKMNWKQRQWRQIAVALVLCSFTLTGSELCLLNSCGRMPRHALQQYIHYYDYLPTGNCIW